VVFSALNDAQRWHAVLKRDRRLDGVFVYGVRSTGIYCRVRCPSRRPRRDRVQFFPVPAAAEQAGFRPCRRCRPRETAPGDPHVALVERACRLLDRNHGKPITLAALGTELGVSPAHLQRTFRSVTGISPRAYAAADRRTRLRTALRGGETVSRALYDAGYGSPSRIYENRAGAIGMTPATFRAGGRGMRIGFATAPSPLGRVLVAATDRGVCFVCLGDSDGDLSRALRAEFPLAIIASSEALRAAASHVVARMSGRVPRGELPLDIRATAFQQAVWDELRRVPAGVTTGYAELARRIGRPTAVRAVARAVATNPVAVIIPCHRVVRSDGAIGGYRWGVGRKRALLAAESPGAPGS
jgi:AraC family transcriptional regulator of adaptative response/methylated-DNA-[protein]-cysteine methyltransferase